MEKENVERSSSKSAPIRSSSGSTDNSSLVNKYINSVLESSKSLSQSVSKGNSRPNEALITTRKSPEFKFLEFDEVLSENKSIRSNVHYLQKNLLFCGVNHAGNHEMRKITECVNHRHKVIDNSKIERDKATPINTIYIARSSLQTLSRKKSPLPQIFDVSYYGDVATFSPLLGGYNGLIVVRHPLDRVLISTNYYRDRRSKDLWLNERRIFENPSSTLRDYITSLTKRDAILYGIYIACFYFHKEWDELRIVRNLNLTLGDSAHISISFLKVEDLYYNKEQALARIEESLRLDSNSLSNCLLDDKSNKPRSGQSSKYMYSKHFECVHYNYFETRIGFQALQEYGYDDDIANYLANKKNG